MAVLKNSPKFVPLVLFLSTLLKVNNRPIGEISLNLVTLNWAYNNWKKRAEEEEKNSWSLTPKTA
jgi:hypothetical protein